MTKKLVSSPSPSVKESTHDLASPFLLHASSETAWDGLVVRAYHEPRQIEQWAAPPVATLTLGLLLSGTMYLEQRNLDGPWKGRYIRQGDLFLRPAGRAPYELRWNVLSAQPVQTLLLHLHADLISQTAEELANFESRHLMVEERVGFQDPLLLQIGLTLWQELEQQMPAGTLYLQAAAQLLAVHLLQRATPAVENSKLSITLLTRQQMRRVTDFILAHLGQDLSLELLAQQTGLIEPVSLCSCISTHNWGKSTPICPAATYCTRAALAHRDGRTAGSGSRSVRLRQPESPEPCLQTSSWSDSSGLSTHPS